jgi:hypothetical protein
MAATRGQLKKTPAHKAARIGAGVIHGGVLSAPAAWLANLTQMMNTISDVGFINTIKAMKDWLKAEPIKGPALARKYRLGLEPQHLIESLGARRGGGGIEEMVSKVTGKLTAGFSAAERFNKQTAFRLHYATAKRAGLSHRSAISKALKGVAEEHFFYGPTGTPVIAQKHPLAAQYTSYPLLQTEWFAKALRERPEVLSRYGVQLYGLAKGMKAAGISPEAVSPTTLYPFERRPGGDVGLRLPPAIQRGREAVELGAAALAGEPEEARRRGRRLLSGTGRTLARVPFGIARGAEELKGQVTSPTTGLPLYVEPPSVPHQTKAYRAALYGLGFTPEEHARQRHVTEAVGTFQKESQLFKRRSVQGVVDALEAKDQEAALRALDEAKKRGVTITTELIKNEMERRRTGMLERKLQGLSKEEAQRLAAPPQ